MPEPGYEDVPRGIDVAIVLELAFVARFALAAVSTPRQKKRDQ